MNPKWMKLAGALLKRASEEFVNHGSNDWNFPKDWTELDRLNFIAEIHKDNGTPDEAGDCTSLPDWWVMLFLGKQLVKESKA